MLELEGLASMEDARELSDFGNEEDDDNSVDERAEKFIERFYEEIKLQRQESLLEQFNAMVDNWWKHSSRHRGGARILNSKKKNVTEFLIYILIYFNELLNKII